MKKSLCFLLVIFLLLPCLLTGCGEATADEDTFTVVTTTFPVYDWVCQIVGDREDIQIILLLDNKEDMHTYQPTGSDLITLTTCDLLIHVGGIDDAWIEDALKSVATPPAVVNLMDVLGDGVKAVEHHHLDEDVDHDHHEPPTDIDTADEHVWLSLKNAAIFCRAIADSLIQLDPDGADRYNQNTDAYTASLRALDNDYRAVVDKAKRDTLLFADRFPFLYLVEDYGLHYYAAFAGCSADIGATAETATFLAEQIDRLSLPCVLVIKDSPVNIASGVIQNTVSRDQVILTLDAMQSVTTAEVEAGATYLGIMQKNLDVLTSALN